MSEASNAQRIHALPHVLPLPDALPDLPSLENSSLLSVEDSSDLMLEEPSVPTFEEWDELLFSSSAVSSANGDNTKDFNPGSLTLSEVNNTYQFQDHLQEYEEHCHLTPV